jgi:hypothetical protein
MPVAPGEDNGYGGQVWSDPEPHST